MLKAAPTVFPPAVAKPEGVASRRYSPFIGFRGSTTVYNAPSGFVKRPGMVLSPVSRQPDIIGEDLAQVVDQILEVDLS